MKKMITAVMVELLLAPSVAVSDVSRTAEDLENHHAQVFANLVQKYCVKFRETPAKLLAKLKVDGFNKNEDYDATFEKYIDNVDYAITLDQAACTTDVLLKPESTLLFELSQVERILISELMLSATKTTVDYELSHEDKRTKVEKRDYIDKQGRKYSLIFPLENQSEYYMTFDVYWNLNDAANKAK